ncbi:MAG: chitobiase/beta-hexosaminidase C-terminal domain-containing protein [Oligosphaeraceae bacterium]
MFSLPRPAILLPLVLGLALPLLPLRADTIKADKVTIALDSPAGLSFTECTGATLRTSYTNTNIGNEEDTGTGKVLPVAGANFLELTGTSTPAAKPRSGRVKAKFSFSLQGAGTLTFQHRVNTYGFNDDVLVFYEGDIDDEDAELLSLGGDYWSNLEKDEDGNRWYDVNDYSFWNEDSLSFSADAYSRTIQVALLAPALDEWYEAPDADTKSENDLQYKAWLDAFVWEPDEDAFLCEVLPQSGTSFGANGIFASLETDYLQDDGTPLFTFHYTLDGSTPSAKSPLYNAEDGIYINQTCRLRVAVYEGTTLVTDAISADYTLREPPKAPQIQVSPGDPFVSGASVHFFPGEEGSHTLDYRYTTDGSTPAADSPGGSTCALDAPCTLKVRAYDDGTLGEVATFTATRAPAPVVSRILDVLDEEEKLSSSNGVFLKSAELFLAASTRPADGEWEIYIRADGYSPTPASSPIIVGGDTTVEFLLHRKEGTLSPLYAGGQGFLLDSATQSCTLRKAQEDDGQWLLSQLSRTGWNLVGITRELPARQQQEILAWLRPLAYSPAHKTYSLATELAAGNSYWVFLSNGQPPETGTPDAFYSAEASAAQETGNTQWRLVPQDALYFYDGTHYRQTPGVPNDLPGWTNAP